MKERPISFSPPMVLAIIEGRKNQTRRACKGQRELSNIHDFQLDRCPYGKTGDRLWVRESGWEEPCQFGYAYDADGISGSDAKHYKLSGWKRRPSIFMPRWASRILLKITDVQVERLQDISEADAVAEGVEKHKDEPEWWRDYYNGPENLCPFAVHSYATLWESINGKGSWDANPWVWVISFRMIRNER